MSILNMCGMYKVGMGMYDLFLYVSNGGIISYQSAVV